MDLEDHHHLNQSERHSCQFEKTLSFPFSNGKKQSIHFDLDTIMLASTSKETNGQSSRHK